MSSRLKILLSAYACAPGQGSEPGVGWKWAVEAAWEHDVWVLTWTKFREPIERYLAENPIPHLRFVYYDLPRWLQPFAVSERLHYILWQAAVLPLARRLQRHQRFDVVHHLTFNTVEIPGLLWSLGAPFVWGPVGGGQVPPPTLRSYFRGLWLAEIVRSWRKRLLRFNPLVRIAARRASAILVSNLDTRRILEPLAKAPLIDEVELAADIGPPPSKDKAPRPRSVASDNDVLIVLWAGRFIPRKGPLLALDVAAELKRRAVPFHLFMAGDGPWEKLVADRIEALDLLQTVDLLGPLAHGQMPDFYARGDVFLFTSLQDTSGNVVLESMTHGLPVVSLDHHGAASLLTDECGVKVPILSQQQVIEDMASALQALANDPQRRRSLGAAARERVADHFTWAHKAHLLRELYDRASGRSLQRAFSGALARAVK